ncbi:MAG: YdcF family protein [Anaerolineae bacterium]|nr:YdcF family protein [Anaerolineae bacterium]
MRQRLRILPWRRWLLVAVVGSGVLGAVIVGGLAAIIVVYGQMDHAREADVIIVLGAGEVGTARRAEHAASLYQQGYAPYVLCTGVHVATGTVQTAMKLTEAEWCAKTVQQHGVPAGAIVMEEHSLSTEENAIESAAIMRARHWSSAVIVSDDFHLFRAKWLFEQQGVRVYPSPAQITTNAGITDQEKAIAVLREVAALVWQVGKSLLGLSYTHV